MVALRPGENCRRQWPPAWRPDARQRIQGEQEFFPPDPGDFCHWSAEILDVDASANAGMKKLDWKDCPIPDPRTLATNETGDEPRTWKVLVNQRSLAHLSASNMARDQSGRQLVTPTREGFGQHGCQSSTCGVDIPGSQTQPCQRKPAGQSSGLRFAPNARNGRQQRHGSHSDPKQRETSRRFLCHF